MAVTYGMVDGHWTVDRTTKKIAYIGQDHGGGDESYATVIQFHRWVQALADDAVAIGDDELDITNTDPSRRSTDNIITLINGYTLDETGQPASEHLYDGSIIQNGGDDVWDGIVNFGNSDVQIQLIQNGVVLSDDWWNQAGIGLNPLLAAGISHRFMIKTRTAGVDIDGRRILGTTRTFGNTYAEFPINGTSRGNNVLALSDTPDLNNETVEGTVSGWAGIVNNNEGYVGIDVNNNGDDEWYYSEWDRDVYTINQFYERMKWLTRDGSASTLYGLNGELFRGITHQIVITPGSGTWVEPEEVVWDGNTPGTGQLLAVNDTAGGSTTAMWIQLLVGQAPSGGVSITGNGGAIGVQGTVTERTISKPFCGQSTGSAIIGSYGLGIEVTDLTSNDKVTDLGNNVVSPPNFVTNTVGGLISGEDRVLVGPWDGSSVDTNGDPDITKDQLSLTGGGLTTDDVGSIVVLEAIPLDTPNVGTIRVTDNDGFERWIPYSSWAVSTFIVNTGHPDIGNNNDFNSVNASDGNNVWISYIDESATGTLVTAGSFVTSVTYVIETTGTTDFTLIGAANSSPGTIFTATGAGTGTGTARIQSPVSKFTSVQVSSRNLVAIVRDGGGTPIKQFISAWSQTTSPQTLTAIRTTDA